MSIYNLSWIDGFDNPNDHVRKNLKENITTYPDGSEKCGLQYYHYNVTHKQKPGMAQ